MHMASIDAWVNTHLCESIYTPFWKVCRSIMCLIRLMCKSFSLFCMRCLDRSIYILVLIFLCRCCHCVWCDCFPGSMHVWMCVPHISYMHLCTHASISGGQMSRRSFRQNRNPRYTHDTNIHMHTCKHHAGAAWLWTHTSGQAMLLA
jgi:hypothetical protein